MIPLSRVSLVMPVYNQLLHTMQRLEPILRLSDKVGELTVVDNASTDGTLEYLKGIDGITVIRNAAISDAPRPGTRGSRAVKGA